MPLGTTPVFTMLGVVNGRACKNAWRAITDALQRTGENDFTRASMVYLVEDVRLRWKTLRDRYVREIGKRSNRLAVLRTRAVPP